MKLEGSLDAFGLPDIFQLLSHTRKTGGLHLRRGGADGVVYFEEGAVCGASADERLQALARRLVGSGTVDDNDLRAAVGRAVEEKVGVGRALLEADAVDPELLREAATEQTFDAVFDLMCWTEGDFAFAADESDPDGVGLRLPADRVVEEAQSRRSAWESAGSGVPSPETVLTMPVVLDSDPSLSRDEWALLALVDGRRPVREIVELTGAGQFAVVSTLSRLVERGLLAVRDDVHDHAAVVARRLALLSPLEGGATVPHTGERRSGAAEESPAPEEPEPTPTVAAPVDIAPEVVHHIETVVERTTDDAPAVSSRELSPVAQIVPPPGERPVNPTPGPGMHTDLGIGNLATVPDPVAIERDPNVNRSLLLRLIAGVRGL